MTTEQLVKGITSGKRRQLAKAITLIESNKETDQQQARELLNELQEARETIRIGISGVPGVGKSTFIEALGMHLIEEGHKVAVLAVDPSSPSSGGSILGDKTRMEKLSSRKEAFIRPSPTSGTLGGVARRTRESMLLCEAAGYDVILIETVGVGQSEFEVASMVDCFMVLMLPGAGDSLQGIKRGILEITDIMVINKADGEQQKMAERAKAEYQHAFHLLSPKYEGIEVGFYTVSSIEEKGIDKVWEGVKLFMNQLREVGRLEELRKSQELNWFRKMAEREVVHRFWNSDSNKKLAEQLMNQIQKGEITPSEAAEIIIHGEEP